MNTSFQSVLSSNHAGDEADDRTFISTQASDVGNLRDLEDINMARQNQGHLEGDERHLDFGGRCPVLEPAVILKLTTRFAPYRTLILSSLDHDRYRSPAGSYDKKVILGGFLFCQWRLESLQVYNTVRHNVLMIEELIAPFVAAQCYCTPDDALIHSKAVLASAIPQEVRVLCPRLTAEAYLAVSDNARHDINRAGLPAMYPFTQDQIMGFNAGQVIQFIDICTTFMDEADDERLGLSLLTNFIIAVCKQGTILSDFQEKIRSAVRIDLGKDVKITPEIVSGAWGAYGQYIDDTNVGSLMTHLTACIAGEAVRLSITVLQSQYHALTAFCTIQRAMIKYPTFAWHAFEKIAAGELENYKQALIAVGDNPYYGFKKDFGPVKSAKFRSLAYFSKELLVKLDGENNLNANRVFKAKIARADLIDKVVAHYIKETLDADESEF